LTPAEHGAASASSRTVRPPRCRARRLPSASERRYRNRRAGFNDSPRAPAGLYWARAAELPACSPRSTGDAPPSAAGISLSGPLVAAASQPEEVAMDAVKDSSHLYDVERRARHAERPGFRISELQISPQQRVPWHYHTNIQDTFYVLEGRLRLF